MFTGLPIRKALVVKPHALRTWGLIPAFGKETSGSRSTEKSWNASALGVDDIELDG